VEDRHPAADALMITQKRWIPLALILGAELCCFLLGAVFYFGKGGFPFTSWESLGTPPGRAREILRVEVYEVYVSTQDNRTYLCNMSPLEYTQDCWTETSDIPPQSPYCIPQAPSALTSPPAGAVSQVSYDCAGGPDTLIIHWDYLIDRDGAVWARSHNNLVFYTYLYSCFGAILAPLGVLVALVAFWLYRRVQELHE
jgi:hypothetical protein